MKQVKIKHGKVEKKTPLTLTEMAGYLEVLGGVAIIALAKQFLGGTAEGVLIGAGIAIGVGATHIVRNMLNHAK